MTGCIRATGGLPATNPTHRGGLLAFSGECPVLRLPQVDRRQSRKPIQFESNAMTVEDAANNRGQLTDLVAAWRRQSQRPDLPFLIMQLPAYEPEPEEETAESWNRLRTSQQEAVTSLPASALVDFWDLGDQQDIHPSKKYEVGERLARRSRLMVYDRNRLSAP